MHSKKILIVEDEKEVASLLEEFLRDEGFKNIEQAADGTHAVQKARKGIPDLILLDLKIPGGDGITVFKKLRQDPSTARIPIIVITSVTDDTTKRRLLSSGVRTYVQKPYKPDLLMGEIKKALQEASNASVFGY